MDLTRESVLRLHGRPVNILSYDGRPLTKGTIEVEGKGPGLPAVEIKVQTEDTTLCCKVPESTLPALLKSERPDGFTYWLHEKDRLRPREC